MNVARQHYLDAARLSPKDVRVYEQLLLLDMKLKRRDDARDHARIILDLDLDHTMANYVLGTIYFSEGENELAEAMLRRSLQRKRHPDALNHLAWVLSTKGEYAEAAIHARQAVTASTGNGLYWDTLGMIELKSGRVEQAAKALEQALSLLPGHPEIKLHVAELRIAQSRMADAKVLANEVREIAGSLPPSISEKLQELESKLKP